MDSYGNCVYFGSWSLEFVIIDGCDGYIVSC